MISIPSSTSIVVVHEAVSFGCGIDGMRGHCLKIVKQDPFERGYFLFINKRRNQARVIWYDNQGFLLLTKRLSNGSFKNWPKKGECVFSLVEHFQAQGLLTDSKPDDSAVQKIWKKTTI